MKLFEIPMVVTSLAGLCFLAGLDAPPAQADFTFGEPINCGFPPGVNTATDVPVCLSGDGLEMYITSPRGGGQGGADIWVWKRASVDDDWGPPENLGPLVNSASGEGSASISADGLELYFSSNPPGGYGMWDIYVTKRATRTSPWGPPTNLGPKVNSAYNEGWLSVSSDDLELYFASDRPGGSSSYTSGLNDLYVSKRATTSDPWGDSVNLGPAVNSPAGENAACLSPDGLRLVFQDGGGVLRPGGYGQWDLWMTSRASRSAPWEPVANLGPTINGPSGEGRPCFAPDGSALYFMRDAGYWKAPIFPIVDFNGDGKVDGKEVLAMAQHWGQSQRLSDIGPSPMGDGTVDVNDLKVLAGYIGQEVNDPTLIAHWALDETEGTAAADSVGGNDLTVLGDATWQPDSGKIGGALAFDGKDDFATSGSVVLDPAAGPFSVIAWIKGGVKNRVIVSQMGGADWLYLNADGKLATGLIGKAGKALISSASLLDDQWHRVVLTWDGTSRTLGVDGVEVAKDTQASLVASSGKLNIGIGKTLAPATRWSGLIDDVRIYNRAVAP